MSSLLDRIGFFRRFRVCASHVQLVGGSIRVPASSVMEPSDRHTETLFRLAAVYRCVETASKPRGIPEDVARWMFPQVCGGEGAELTRISVTVVGKIASCVTAQRSRRLLHFPPEVASYFTELLKVLFDDLNLMSHLVSDLHGAAVRWQMFSMLSTYFTYLLYSIRCPTLTVRIRFCPIWLPRVHQLVFFIFFTSRLEVQLRTPRSNTKTHFGILLTFCDSCLRHNLVVANALHVNI